MDEKQLLAILAGRLGVGANAQAVHDAITRQLDSAKESVALFSRTKDAVILFAKGGADKLGGLKAVLAALGVENPDEAMAGIGEKLRMSQQLLEAMPELASLYNARAEAEDAAAEGDVQQAVAASRVPQSLVMETAQAMMWSRTGGVELPRLPVRADGTVDHTPLLDDARRKALFDALRQRAVKRDEFAQKVQGGGAAQVLGAPPQHRTALFQRFFAPAQQQGGGGAPQTLFGRQGTQGFANGAPQGGQGWPGGGAPMGGGIFGGNTQGPALFDSMRQAQPPTIQIDGVEVPVPDLSDNGGIAGANETERAKNYLLSNGYKGDYDAVMTRANMIAEAFVHTAQPQGGRF